MVSREEIEAAIRELDEKALNAKDCERVVFRNRDGVTSIEAYGNGRVYKLAEWPCKVPGLIWGRG